ncbi:MAG TPA: hypothetical protein PKY71_03970 [Smithellaceae bacterium]|nr:hypothetical protein [Smithella sp.]HPL96678.1 hypothetical protein [Smithellaceae bacterium]
MVTKRDYSAEAVQAAKSVLIELVHLLGEYRDHAVLIGGWVPEMLFVGSKPPHVGSMDIDLALDHQRIGDTGYRMIGELLLGRGYLQGAQPFIYYRDVVSGDKTIRVQVDFLSGEYAGTGKSHRHQKVQDLLARKVRGCDLVFDLSQEVILSGDLPGGGLDTVTVRVASVVPFLVMKGMALDERLKEKDAWDIYFCVLHYPGGITALAEAFRPHLTHGLIREGLDKIEKHFSSTDHIGPKFVADFEEVEEAEERSRIIRDAYERIGALLKKLKNK